MKKVISIILSFCLLFVMVAACADDQREAPAPTTETPTNEAPTAEPPAPEPENRVFTIGYSYPTINNEFWALSLNHFMAASEQLGFNVNQVDCDNDPARQLTDVENLIAAGIDALVLAPQDATIAPGVLAMAAANGIPVVIIDRWPGDEFVAGEDYVAFIGPNDEAAGYAIAMSLIDNGATRIVALGGFQGTSVAEGRHRGLENALAANPHVTLLQQEWAGENWDDGDRVFRGLMAAHDNIEGVWAYNDSLALASVNVLMETGQIDNVLVGGMDLLGPAIESMQAGQLWFSTGGHFMQAAFAAVILYDVLNDTPYDGAPVIQLNLLNVSQDNLHQFIARYVDNPNPVDWRSFSRFHTPGAPPVFELTLD